MKLAFNLCVPSESLCATGHGCCYNKTYIVEIDKDMLPQDVQYAINDKNYAGVVQSITIVK